MTTPDQALFTCVLATQNAHKIDEIAPHLSSSLQWLTLKQANWTGGVLREDADTFEGNALQKAVQGYRGTMLPTLADDSGLVVPDLEGAPGVRSARYAGEQATDAENRAKASPDLLMPAPLRFAPDAITREVLDLVAVRFPDHFGDLEPFWFATTRAEAEAAFAHFLRHALPQFGTYQDAMLKSEKFLYHAVVSPYLNVGLLDPC